MVMRRVSCQAPLCSITHYYAFRVTDPLAFIFERVKAVAGRARGRSGQANNLKMKESQRRNALIKIVIYS